jgi:hypothetical protein
VLRRMGIQPSQMKVGDVLEHLLLPLVEKLIQADVELNLGGLVPENVQVYNQVVYFVAHLQPLHLLQLAWIKWKKSFMMAVPGNTLANVLLSAVLKLR